MVMLMPCPGDPYMITTIHQLQIDPTNMRKTQLADKQLALVIKALEGGKPLPANSAPGLSSKMDFCVKHFNHPHPPLPKHN